MPYLLLADVVVAIHLGFVGFVAFGGFLAARHPRLLMLHVPACLWGLGIVTVGWPCPLTALEQSLRARGGEAGYSGGFVDRYLTGVLYPKQYERLAQAAVAVAILASYALVASRRRRHRVRASR